MAKKSYLWGKKIEDRNFELKTEDRKLLYADLKTSQILIVLASFKSASMFLFISKIYLYESSPGVIMRSALSRIFPQISVPRYKNHFFKTTKSVGCLKKLKKTTWLFWFHLTAGQKNTCNLWHCSGKKTHMKQAVARLTKKCVFRIRCVIFLKK